MQVEKFHTLDTMNSWMIHTDRCCPVTRLQATRAKVVTNLVSSFQDQKFPLGFWGYHPVFSESRLHRFPLTLPSHSYLSCTPPIIISEYHRARYQLHIYAFLSIKGPRRRELVQCSMKSDTPGRRNSCSVRQRTGQLPMVGLSLLVSSRSDANFRRSL